MAEVDGIASGMLKLQRIVTGRRGPHNESDEEVVLKGHRRRVDSYDGHGSTWSSGCSQL